MNCAGKAVKLDTLSSATEVSALPKDDSRVFIHAAYSTPIGRITNRLFQQGHRYYAAELKAPRVAVPVKPHTYGIVLSVAPVTPYSRLSEEKQRSALWMIPLQAKSPQRASLRYGL